VRRGHNFPGDKLLLIDRLDARHIDSASYCNLTYQKEVSLFEILRAVDAAAIANRR
jgi:hypothetical protein